ncbi:MAG: hypothetical protein A2X64_07450 [Ignavibacteria bacterium GWF2_33_9]|nr:MAG: hypothetical protein A2X64_07450 [Ignavibacteria bacterium GWF2_33_9]
MEPFVTNRYVYGPYGEPLHYDNEKERQGFIGKEKDLESGLADHGVRKYDYISGRFTSTDPLWEKYMGLTPYQYSANNPVSLLDRNGKDIVVAFSGANFSESKDNATAGKIVNNINSFADKNNVSDLDAKAFPTQAYPSYFYLKEAISFVKQNWSEGENIIIYGYSAGGVAAMNLCKELEKDNLKVNLLITVDAAFSIFSPIISREVSENVELNLNFYQTTLSKILSRGDANYTKGKQTFIKNIKKGSSHSDIDESTQNQVESEIESIILR